MSQSSENEKKPFDPKKLALEIMRQAEQSFVAAGVDGARGGALKADPKLIEQIVGRVIEKVYTSVWEARLDGYTRVQLHAYNVTSVSGANIPAHRVAYERLMAAINANLELHAWVETNSGEDGPSYSECRLMLDFSRLYPRALDASVRLSTPSSD